MSWATKGKMQFLFHFHSHVNMSCSACKYGFTPILKFVWCLVSIYSFICLVFLLFLQVGRRAGIVKLSATRGSKWRGKDQKCCRDGASGARGPVVQLLEGVSQGALVFLLPSPLNPKERVCPQCNQRKKVREKQMEGIVVYSVVCNLNKSPIRKVFKMKF